MPSPRTASSGEKAEQGPGLPVPPPGEVLAALPPANLSALEHALKRFLAKLSQGDPCPPGGRAGAGWYTWVVAGVAAAAASEIARRQLRHSAAAPALEMNGIPDARPDRPPAE
jgi:hypothetical protein